MPRTLRWKWIVIVATLIASLTGILGLPTSRDEILANLKERIRLGLDLNGGSHIVLQLQLQDAFKAEADKAIEQLKSRLQAERIPYDSIERNEPASPEAAAGIEITIAGIETDRVSELHRAVTEALGQDWVFRPAAGTAQRLGMRPESAARLWQDTVSQSISVIDRRINGLGVAETTVQQRGGEGGNQILVQLPGVEDLDRIKEILQTAALLELSSVLDGPFSSEDDLARARNGALPSNSRVASGGSRTDGGQAWWLLSRSPVITGRDLRDAFAERGETPGSWDTAFTLTPSAADRFARFTESNIGKRLAIVLDDTVLSAPAIQSRISDRGRISGSATRQESEDLALNLRAGSLPAGVKFIEERTVRASLGADSIRRGVVSGAVGLFLVIASMIAYYRGAGVNAVVSLLLNTIITVAALSYIGATWTLPGIAGLVLSIGMAVDSNVLIFERIKEDLRAGSQVARAIASGFDRALVTIVDTHVTTVVASAFLFMFGAGPVRGFAVTLAIGLAANLFTAVFVSRALFDLKLWRNPRLASLNFGSPRAGFFKGSNVGFFRWHRWSLVVSLLLMAVSIAAMLGFGLHPGLDFSGGTMMQMTIDARPPIDDLRRSLSKGLEGEVLAQEAGKPGEFVIETALAGNENLAATRDRVERIVQSEFGSFQTLSAEIVSPRAGAETQRQALLATAGALGGMLIYIAFRFKWISGAAAVLATIHDVVITLGLFVLTGREINLNIVAALLTLIGYSMNDKIVVFDRVRENQRIKGRGGSFVQLVNLSINQTLSRTLLTAGPTLLACLALYFLGGEVLNGIAFALLTGIVVGTYSSIFVAGSLLVLWNNRTLKTSS
jgi:protein-export membrane protein SecD/preprotein translocase SecF subunit